MLLLVMVVVDRKSQIKENGIHGVAKVVDIRRKKKGVTTYRNIVYFTFFIYSKEYKQSVEILNRKVLKGQCYEITYIPTNPEIVDINFNKEIDCSNYKKE